MSGSAERHNSVRCVKFTPSALAEAVRRACGAPRNSQTNQVLYIGNYLSELDAATMVVEDHYVDRQFVEECASYYARCLKPIPNYCSRIHFFTGDITDDALSDVLEKSVALDGKTNAAQAWLQSSYLGFTVIRPLPATPVGRTVLKPYPATTSRSYPPIVKYSVHVLGLELSVEGVAFQQQDQAVAACATTAVWSALQRVCRHEGVRAPTTSEITAEAVRHYLPDGRPFPSDGLHAEQMSDALRAFQFPPDLLQVDPSPRFFMMQVHSYLRSGIPVVLGLSTPEGGHAVTAVGFARDHRAAKTHSVPGADGGGSVEVRMRNLEYQQLYVHDDRMGPYARATLRPGPGKGPFEVPEAGTSDDSESRERTRLDLALEWPDAHTELTAVRIALVPLYPKLRTSAEELIGRSLGWASELDGLRASAEAPLALEVFFDRAGSYQTQLYSSSANPGRLAQLQRQLTLSRYVAVSRWYEGESFLGDILWDTTDRLRAGAIATSVLALVGYTPAASHRFLEIGETIGVPAA